MMRVGRLAGALALLAATARGQSTDRLGGAVEDSIARWRAMHPVQALVDSVFDGLDRDTLRLTRGCRANIPATRMRRGVLMLEGRSVPALGDLPARLGEAAAQLADRISLRLRREIASSTEGIPIADGRYDWRSSRGAVEIRFGRAKRAEVRVLQTGFSTAIAERVRQLAVEEVSSIGELPEGATGPDSIVALLLVRAPVVTDTGSIPPKISGVGFDLFSMPLPMQTPLRQLRGPSIRFPEANLATGLGGRVILDFLVDSTGSADPASAREYWPSGSALPTGDAWESYKRFRSAVVRGLASSRYEAPTFGGCPLAIRVKQPFELQRGR